MASSPTIGLGGAFLGAGLLLSSLETGTWGFLQVLIGPGRGDGAWEQWEVTLFYEQSCVSATISRDLLMKIHTQVLINSGLLPGPLRGEALHREGGWPMSSTYLKRLANNFNSPS